jgi:hypothetical protein
VAKAAVDAMAKAVVRDVVAKVDQRCPISINCSTSSMKTKMGS